MATYVDLRQSTDPAKARSSRPHMVRYRDLAGKQRAEQFSRKSDATTRLREVESAEQTGRLDVIDGGKQTLAQIGARFFRLERSGWEATTANEYRYIWNSAVLGRPRPGSPRKYPRAAIADMPVRMIRKSHVTEFREDALAVGVPAGSVSRALSLITRALDVAEDDGLIQANPAARVKPPKPKARPTTYVVAPAEVEAIRAKLDGRDAAIVSVLAYAGLRPAELRALTVNHLSRTHLEISASVRDDGTLKGTKSANGRRSVPVCAALAADLAAVDWGNGYLLKNASGGPWTKTDWANWRTRKFAPAVKAAGVLLKDPYKLRHSIASLWYRQGIDKATIARWLGHSIPVLESVYAQQFTALDAADKRSVDELIAAARRPARKARSKAA
jgi:integrase